MSLPRVKRAISKSRSVKGIANLTRTKTEPRVSTGVKSAPSHSSRAEASLPSGGGGGGSDGRKDRDYDGDDGDDDDDKKKKKPRHSSNDSSGSSEKKTKEKKKKKSKKNKKGSSDDTDDRRRYGESNRRRGREWRAEDFRGPASSGPTRIPGPIFIPEHIRMDFLVKLGSLYGDKLIDQDSDLTEWDDYYDYTEDRQTIKWWKCMLRWFQTQDMEAVLNAFNEAASLRMEAEVNEEDDDDVQMDWGDDHREKNSRKDERRRRSREKIPPKSKRRDPSPPSDPSDDEGSGCDSDESENDSFIDPLLAKAMGKKAKNTKRGNHDQDDRHRDSGKPRAKRTPKGLPGHPK
eukprot:4179709-Amphidinium_carterae.1